LSKSATPDISQIDDNTTPLLDAAYTISSTLRATTPPLPRTQLASFRATPAIAPPQLCLLTTFFWWPLNNAYSLLHATTTFTSASTPLAPEANGARMLRDKSLAAAARCISE
jgi:hypothetical protein